jgi:uncharacterized membrane protein
MKKAALRLIRIFTTGLLTALPLTATVILIVFVLNLIMQSLGPNSGLGKVLISIGIGVSGSELVGYVIGLSLLFVLIFFLGLLVERGLQRGLVAMINAVVSRIPIVRNVYETIGRFVDLVSRKEGDGLATMQPVWCSFGGPGGAVALGLLSTPVPVMVGDVPSYGVLIPTAPVPVGGGLLYVPVSWVQPAEIGMEALTSIYVSMGVTSAQHMRTAPALATIPKESK